MRVKVKVFGPLVALLSNEKRKLPIDLDLPDGSTVADVFTKLGIGQTSAVILINDQEAHHGKSLKDGDVVSLFPPLAGGK